MTDEERAKSYCTELILLGVMLAKDGDPERARNAANHQLFQGPNTKRCALAIQEKEGPTVWDCLAFYGVQRVNNESAVDAILRLFLQEKAAELEGLL